MEEQPAYCWKDVGSIPTTSAVGWEGLNGLKNRSHTAIQRLNFPERVRLVLWGGKECSYVVCEHFFFYGNQIDL